MKQDVGTARIAIRARIEGVPTDEISAIAVSTGVNVPATAQVIVAAIDEATHLLPRTVFQLSYSLDGSTFSHLFNGELYGFDYIEEDSGTKVVLKLIDMTTYWDAAKQYYARDDELFPGETSRIAAFMGTDKTEYMPILSSPGWDVVSALRKEPACMPGVRGLIGGIVHLLERVGGVYKGPRKFGGLNEFFNQAEIRLRLTQRMWASAKDDTCVRMFKHSTFSKWLRRVVQSRSGITSFRDLSSAVLGMIYHHYVPIVAPYFSKGGRTIHIPGTPGGPGGTRSSLPDEVKAFIESRLSAVRTLMHILDDLKGLREDVEDSTIARAKSAHVAYGNGVNSAFAYGKIAHLASLIESEVASQLFGGSSGVVGGGASSYEYSAAHAYPNAIHQVEGQSEEPLTSEEERLPEDLSTQRTAEGTWTYEFRLVDSIFRQLYDAELIYANLLGKKARGGGGRAPRDVKTVDRLIETVFIPDIYFVAPPVCNVIFPDQRSNQVTSRNFLQEITRLRLTTKESWGGGDEFLAADPLGTSKKIAVAPNLMDVRGAKILADAKRGSRIIMPHEVFTGIIPDFKQLPYLNIFVTSSDDEIGYLQRTAEYLYIKGRMEARPVQVVSRVFLPHVVAGFPALVVAHGDGKRHRLGMVTSVAHMIKADGDASTSIVMADARYHDETYDGPAIKKEAVTGKGAPRGSGYLGEISRMSAELSSGIDGLLGFYSHAQTSLLSELPNVPTLGIKAGELEAVLLRGENFMFDIAKRFGQATEQEQVTSGDPVPDKSKVGAALSKFQSALALLHTAWRTAERIAGTLPGMLDEKDPSDENDGISRIIHDQVTPVIKSLLEAQSQLGVHTGGGGRGVKRTLVRRSGPLEDFLRPSWVSEIYDRDRVGKEVYQECLGTGSIVDAYGGESIQECVENLVEAYRDSVEAGEVWAFIAGLTNRPVATEDEVTEFQSNAVWNVDTNGEIELPPGITDQTAFNSDLDPREARYERAADLVEALKKGVGR